MPAVADTFYRNLFERHPDLLSMFPADLARQRQKFADELLAIVRAIADMPAFLDTAAQLGERHVGYGVRVAHYQHVRVALLDALATELGAEWTPPAAAAWAEAYDLIAEAMLLSRRG